jgi:hypothetical protein
MSHVRWSMFTLLATGCLFGKADTVDGIWDGVCAGELSQVYTDTGYPNPYTVTFGLTLDNQFTLTEEDDVIAGTWDFDVASVIGYQYGTLTDSTTGDSYGSAAIEGVRTEDLVVLTAVDPFTSSGSTTTTSAGALVFEFVQDKDTLTGGLGLPLGGTTTGAGVLDLACDLTRLEE